VSTPSVLFRQLKWISIHNLVVYILRGEHPKDLRNLFTFARGTREANSGMSSTDLKLPIVSIEFAKTKLSYRDARLLIHCD
jgi:hypothetical protein